MKHVGDTLEHASQDLAVRVAPPGLVLSRQSFASALDAVRQAIREDDLRDLRAG